MDMFKGCKSLASVTIGNGVTGIYRESFSGCTSLKSVVIPRGVTEITFEAFKDCTSLASVTIPRSVTEIDTYAFRLCSPNLKILYDGTKAQWEATSGSKPKATVQCSDGVITVK